MWSKSYHVLDTEILELHSAMDRHDGLFYREPVPETHAQFLDALNSANASRRIGTEQTAVGGFVCESAYCAKAQIDSARCELTRFAMRPKRNTTILLNAKPGSEQYQSTSSSMA
jgi:hypothetical protein